MDLMKQCLLDPRFLCLMEQVASKARAGDSMP